MLNGFGDWATFSGSNGNFVNRTNRRYLGSRTGKKYFIRDI